MTTPAPIPERCVECGVHDRIGDGNALCWNCATKPATPLEHCVGTYQKWMHLPDPDQVLASLGGVAGNLLDGDALWLLLVGSSGSGKTETIDPLDAAPYVHRIAMITEAGLLSGSSKRDTEPGATGGVLRQVGEFGVLLAKDFGSVLSMHRDARAQVMAALREIADGSWVRPLGTTGGRSLTWSGKCGLVGAVTPTIDRHYSVMGALGERFLLYRLQVSEPRAQARQRLRNRGREREMRAELGTAVADVLGTVQAGAPPELSEPEAERLVDLATFVVWARTPVERDGYNREVVAMPSREAPARLAGSLGSLLGGLEAIGADYETRWRITEKVAWDCLPNLRYRLLSALRELSPVKTGDLVSKTGMPKTTAERTLEDLSLLGLTIRDKEGGRDNAPWIHDLAPEARGAWPRSPEVSGGVAGVSLKEENTPVARENNVPLPAMGDISGEHPVPAETSSSLAVQMDRPTTGCTDCGGWAGHRPTCPRYVEVAP